MPQVTITRHDHPTHGEYRAKVEGFEQTGVLTYKKRDGGSVLAADHTIVPTELRGQGIAGELVRALIADARKESTKIVPLCSYVEAAFRRHPEWSDLRA